MGDSFSIGEGVGAHLAIQTPSRPSVGIPQATDDKDKIGKSGTADRPEHDPEPIEPINFKNSRYQIKMDGETGQLFTDIVDPMTDAVVGRIPSYFKPSDETPLDSESNAVPTTDKRTVTI